MLSIEQIRHILGDEYKSASDEEVLNLTSLLKSICSIVVESYVSERDKKKST